MTKQKGICEKCGKEYEYEYNPKYPRKYCPVCSVVKQKAYKDMQNAETFPVEKITAQNAPVSQNNGISKKNTMPKDPVGLAVEIFCVMKDKSGSMADESIMKHSIDLVKEAQEAFS